MVTSNDAIVCKNLRNLSPAHVTVFIASIRMFACQDHPPPTRTSSTALTRSSTVDKEIYSTRIKHAYSGTNPIAGHKVRRSAIDSQKANMGDSAAY
jgi:hypothetical protein